MIPYVIYSRKSLEDDDKQIQSIPSQEIEMNSVAARLNLTVIKPLLSESKSAKAPGRPVFNEMMQRVDRGEIKGILCWKLDRLARNPVDGGRIIWAIKQHGLVIRTPHQSFSQAEDNLILMYIEFGMAQKYVDDLSRNTTRGLKTKADKGWLPGVAPIGYLNSKVEERGQKTIRRDPDRFDVVRRMWDLMLTGNHNPAKIQKIANEEWGLRTRQTKRTGGKPLSRSSVYQIFNCPFYYGRFEYPNGSGLWYDGKHEPMVTHGEFEQVQKMLHRDTNSPPKTEYALPFRGVIKCGECGSSITAHFKEQVRCTRCHYKSSVKNRAACFKCGLPIAEMKKPTIRRYAYYHCTHSRNPLCRQKSIAATALEQQLTEKIKSFAIPTELRDWGVVYLGKLRDQSLAEKQDIMAGRKKAYEQCVMRLENLVRLKTAPENADGSLLSDEEYQKQRTDLLEEKSKLAGDVAGFESGLEEKVRLLRHALDVVGKIENQSSSDDAQRKREIFGDLGLNHVLKEKELEIRPQFPFSDFPRAGTPDVGFVRPIEPENIQSGQGSEGIAHPVFPKREREPDEDRTKALKSALDLIWEKLDPLGQHTKRS